MSSNALESCPPETASSVRSPGVRTPWRRTNRCTRDCSAFMKGVASPGMRWWDGRFRCRITHRGGGVQPPPPHCIPAAPLPNGLAPPTFIVPRLPPPLADPPPPPQVAVIALPRSGRGRGDRGDHDDARLPLPHQSQLLPRDGLDVLVGVQVLAKRLQALAALLEIGHFSLQLVLTLPH